MGKSPCVTRAVEVTCVCRFTTFWNDRSGEVAAMQAGTWSPSTDDFHAVANVPNAGTKPKTRRTEVFEIESFGEMLGALQNDINGKPRAKGSVRRLNIISHGRHDFFALAGKVIPGNVIFRQKNEDLGDNVSRQMSGGIDHAAINMLNDEGKSLRNELRTKFCPDGDIALILCHAGLGQGLTLMIDLARTLECSVHGYSDEVHYQAHANPGAPIDRGFTAKSKNGPFAKGYPVAVKVPSNLAGKHMLPFDKAFNGHGKGFP